MVKQVAIKLGLAAAGLALMIGVGMQTAAARTFVAVGIGDPLRTGLVASLAPRAETSPGTRSSARK